MMVLAQVLDNRMGSFVRTEFTAQSPRFVGSAASANPAFLSVALLRQFSFFATAFFLGFGGRGRQHSGGIQPASLMCTARKPSDCFNIGRVLFRAPMLLCRQTFSIHNL